MDYISYCKTALNITNVEECATKVAEGSQKLWVVYVAAYVIFILLQFLITGAFSKKKGIGFWLGVVGLNIIMLLVIIIFIMTMPQLMVLMEIV